MGSYADAIAGRDDILVKRLRDRGAIIYAKSNVPELGFGGGCTNRLFGPTRNPWNTSRTAGGSSGGSAAALAAREAWLATGSDLGGSLRVPAAFCGVVGYRSTPGVVPFGPRSLPFDLLSVHGPMARSVADAALMLDAMAGADADDPLSRTLFAPGAALRAASKPVSDLVTLRAAWSPDLGGLCSISGASLEVCNQALAHLRKAGLALCAVEPDLTGAKIAVDVLRGTRLATLRHLSEQFAGDLSPHLKREIERGSSLTAAHLALAESVRSRIWYAFATMMKPFDFLICPTTITTAFAFDEISPREVAGIRFENYSDWFLLTHVLSLTGCPAITLPCGLDPDGLPVGLQMVALPGRDLELIAAAAAVEATLAFEDRPQGFGVARSGDHRTAPPTIAADRRIA